MTINKFLILIFKKSVDIFISTSFKVVIPVKTGILNKDFHLVYLKIILPLLLGNLYLFNSKFMPFT